MTLLRTTNCVFFFLTQTWWPSHFHTKTWILRRNYSEFDVRLDFGASCDRGSFAVWFWFPRYISAQSFRSFQNQRKAKDELAIKYRGRQTHFLLPVFLERRESVERVRELESRGERERENCGRGRGRKSLRRERWADDKKAAPADVVTTVGVRDESCVPDAWGRDGGEVRWSVRCHVWPLVGCGLASGHRHRSSPRADGVIWRSKRVWAFGPSHSKRSEIFSVKQTCATVYRGTGLGL